MLKSHQSNWHVAHVYLSETWNLMARGSSVQHLTLKNIRVKVVGVVLVHIVIVVTLYQGDALAMHFVTNKSDQEGKRDSTDR